MRKYIKKHLDWMKKEKWTEEEIDYFLSVIVFLQHERFIHLIITIITSVFFFGTGFLFLLVQNIITGILFGIFVILLICYIEYYCFMENSIQSMYYKYMKLRNYVK